MVRASDAIHAFLRALHPLPVAPNILTVFVVRWVCTEQEHWQVGKMQSLEQGHSFRWPNSLAGAKGFMTLPSPCGFKAYAVYSLG